MTHDVAIFLDLDNLVIGAKQSNQTFDINLVLDHLKKLTNGRLVLRHAYGAGQQSQRLLQDLAKAGFVIQSAARINNFSKNLADMQIAVNAMDTLVDGHDFGTYVLMSGDRDFTPLVQSLRRRGKRVVGVGVRHTSSRSLVELCDDYIFYEDLLPNAELSDVELEQLVLDARDTLLKENGRVRASVFKQRLTTASDGRFSNNSFPQASFSKFLQTYPQLISVEQEDSTTYISRPGTKEITVPLHARYRTALKKQRLRIVPAPQRLIILRSLIDHLETQPGVLWHQLLAQLHARLRDNTEPEISKNLINSMLLVARQADVIRTRKGRSLSTAPVMLEVAGEQSFQEAVICVDTTYLKAIIALPEPFDLSEAARALYDSIDFTPYLRRIARN